MSTIIETPRTQKSFLDSKSLTANQAKEKAQYIAFGPVIFKVALALYSLGILKRVEDAGDAGISLDEIKACFPYSKYGLNVLLYGGVQAGLIDGDERKFTLTTTGFFFLNDEMTKVNFDFVNDVCYRPLEYLEESIVTGKPAGLKEFGEWKTVYEGLSQLPKKVQDSWFAFDHFYSDDVFDKILPLIFKNGPIHIMDIGGNTGKFAKRCITYNKDAVVTMVDLPGQLGIAKEAVKSLNASGNIQFYAADMLNPETTLPKGADVIWMSQFLDCFSETEIIAILKKCREVMTDNTVVYILEPLTNRQRYPAASFVVQLTSVYFTAVANGNSRMYSFEDMERMIEAAGLTIAEITEDLGICQTLISCSKGE